MTPQSPVQFGICSWSTHPKGPEDLVSRLSGLGLRKVQLALGPLWKDPATWSSVPQALSGADVQIVSGMFGTMGEDYSSLESIRRTGGFVPDQTWEENWRIVQDTARVARELGLTLVSSHAGFLPDDRDDPAFARLVERISKVAGKFREAGVTLLFETGQETADTLSQFLKALDDHGATNTGVNFDPANMVLYDKGDPIASLKKLLPRVRQVHVKDAVRTTTPGAWGKEVAIGDGQVDWRSFIRTLAEGGYQGDLIIEREAGEDRVGDVKKAIDRLSKVMAEVG